jgi:hypothetical protein
MIAMAGTAHGIFGVLLRLAATKAAQTPEPKMMMRKPRLPDQTTA